jgi:hypothetical protein
MGRSLNSGRPLKSVGRLPARQGQLTNARHFILVRWRFIGSISTACI